MPYPHIIYILICIPISFSRRGAEDEVGRAMLVQARLHRQLGKYQQAEWQAKAALRSLSVSLGFEHPDTSQATLVSEYPRPRMHLHLKPVLEFSTLCRVCALLRSLHNDAIFFSIFG